jgi:hypothetical protein
VRRGGLRATLTVVAHHAATVQEEVRHPDPPLHRRSGADFVAAREAAVQKVGPLGQPTGAVIFFTLNTDGE